MNERIRLVVCTDAAFLYFRLMTFPCSITALLYALAISASFAQTDTRPNILLIVADDLGYADLGCYGGDIRTPNIDQLAKRGLLFSQFHTAPTCAPTRSMLLTGNNNHVAGMGRQGRVSKDSWEATQPGYEGHLSDRVVPMPQVLRDAGYHTYTVGKWHLGKEPENAPSQKGFERSFNLLQGASNHYNNVGLGLDDSVSLYRADGELADFPKGAYSTEFYTDKLIEFLRSGSDGKPFFAYVAYTSPHWPLQAPAANDRYRGKYDMGYDSLRVLRFQSLQRAGIIPATSKLPPQLESIKPWTTLTDEARKIESRKMELYAAMVDNLDQQVGRLLKYLRDEMLDENTLIIFMSDNGAAAEDFYVQRPYADFIAPRYDNRYENMGSPTSFVAYGPSWANAGSAPYSHYKGYATEGGIVAPLIITGKGFTTTSPVRHDFLTVMDLAPTILELAGTKYPGRHGTAETRPMLGQSAVSYLRGKSKTIHPAEYATGLELSGRAYYRKGKWKIVNVERPYRKANFQLFDVTADPGETTNLASKFPDKYEELWSAWKMFCEKNGIHLQER